MFPFSPSWPKLLLPMLLLLVLGHGLVQLPEVGLTPERYWEGRLRAAEKEDEKIARELTFINNILFEYERNQINLRYKVAGPTFWGNNSDVSLFLARKSCSRAARKLHFVDTLVETLERYYEEQLPDDRVGLVPSPVQNEFHNRLLALRQKCQKYRPELEESVADLQKLEKDRINWYSHLQNNFENPVSASGASAWSRRLFGPRRQYEAARDKFQPLR